MKNMDQKQKNKYVRVITLFTIVFICMGFILLNQLGKERSTMKEVEEGSEPAMTIEPYVKAEATPESVSGTLEPVVLTKYNKLLEKNQDVVGMITIPDTKISSYPVLIGENNEYYLKYDINKKASKYGCIFVDYLYGKENIGREFQRHTMIYGHNMKNNSMFGQVADYKDKEFFDSHGYIYFDNLYETGKWKVFSVYVVDADKETINRTYETDEEYLEFLIKVKQRSKFDVDVSLTAKDEVITLCTCSYETDNSRTIVHAVRVDE